LSINRLPLRPKSRAFCPLAFPVEIHSDMWDKPK